jgi:hypothetical protein
VWGGAFPEKRACFIKARYVLFGKLARKNVTKTLLQKHFEPFHSVVKSFPYSVYALLGYAVTPPPSCLRRFSAGVPFTEILIIFLFE